ncbi:MAG: hypothetical protein AAGF77_05905, partial [Bacteroidota bacterium]
KFLIRKKIPIVWIVHHSFTLSAKVSDSNFPIVETTKALHCQGFIFDCGGSVLLFRVLLEKQHKKHFFWQPDTGKIIRALMGRKMYLYLSSFRFFSQLKSLKEFFNKNDRIMDLRADIKWIHEEIDKVDDPVFLEAIKSLLKYRSKVIEGETDRDTIEVYNKDLDDAIKEIEDGKYYTQEEARKIASKW